jgi:hypothetical protein
MAAAKKKAPAKKAAPKKGDEPVRAGRKATQGTGGASTSRERKVLIKKAEEVFGKGGFQLSKSTQRSSPSGEPKLVAISKKAKNDFNTKSVYAYEDSYIGSLNPFSKPKARALVRLPKPGGGQKATKK